MHAADFRNSRNNPLVVFMANDVKHIRQKKVVRAWRGAVGITSAYCAKSSRGSSVPWPSFGS